MTTQWWYLVLLSTIIFLFIVGNIFFLKIFIDNDFNFNNILISGSDFYWVFRTLKFIFDLFPGIPWTFSQKRLLVSGIMWLYQAQIHTSFYCFTTKSVIFSIKKRTFQVEIWIIKIYIYKYICHLTNRHIWVWEKSVGFKATEHILAEHHVTDEIDSPTRFASFKFHGKHAPN